VIDANQTGTAVSFIHGEDAIFVNCTVTGNQGGRNAAGITLQGGEVAFRESILWGNTPREVLSLGPGGPSITYSTEGEQDLQRDSASPQQPSLVEDPQVESLIH